METFKKKYIQFKDAFHEVHRLFGWVNYFVRRDRFDETPPVFDALDSIKQLHPFAYYLGLITYKA